MVHDWPVGVSVDHDEVVLAVVVEVIRAQALEWVVSHSRWDGRHGSLGRRHPVAVVAGCSGGVDVRRDTRPEYG